VRYEKTPLALAALRAAGLTGCGSGGSPGAGDGDPPVSSVPCPGSDRETLNGAPVLEEKPPATELLDDFAECDDGDPTAGRVYRTGTSPANVADFYAALLPEKGWHMETARALTAASGPTDGDLICATSSISGSKAYLVLWYPDEDSGLTDGHPAGSVFLLSLSRRPRTETSCLR
jgi:hypothetical protein